MYTSDFDLSITQMLERSYLNISLIVLVSGRIYLELITKKRKGQKCFSWRSIVGTFQLPPHPNLIKAH